MNKTKTTKDLFIDAEKTYKKMEEYFKYEELETMEDVRKQIQRCEGHHPQQIAYSSFHDKLMQVCFGCKRIRRNKI